MTYSEFYDKMRECGLISSDWENLIKLLSGEVSGSTSPDDAMELLILYFSLLDDGNTYLPLNPELLPEKFRRKIDRQKNDAVEQDEEISAAYEVLWAEISRVAEQTAALNGLPMLAENGLFAIDNDRLFAKKYFDAVRRIDEAAQRLLVPARGEAELPFSWDNLSDSITLNDRQKQIVKDGLGKNLLITGGPGTGKTTSVLFLLLGILCQEEPRKIYLAAPSGKAAARMSESIRDTIGKLNEPFREAHSALLDRLQNAEGQTIHRLLCIDKRRGGFLYNRDNPFEENAVFVIDEASMIDVRLFASLLDAIPDGARVFILGDKNQLPSVECGAVFGELLTAYPNNVVELTESNRFREGTGIYTLAEAVNRGTVPAQDFLPMDSFEINPDAPNGAVFCYADDAGSSSALTTRLADEWYRAYFSDFQRLCKSCDGNDAETFDRIWKRAEASKILCALNETARGAAAVNRKILEHYRGSKISGYYPGELLMICKNLPALGLFNGDCGVTVHFEGDETLYFMTDAAGSLNLEDGKEENNRIFRLGRYYFYPIALIGQKDLSSAFAITVHKSQGSGYEDVFVLLPKTHGHPLLNRQILYTAVTRAKKHVYLFSNPQNIRCAAETVLTRDTGLCIPAQEE